MKTAKDLTKNERWYLAEFLASKNLKQLNVNLKDVVFTDSFYNRYLKRTLDVILSSFALLLSLPINIVVAMIVYFDVGRPIFFKQTRVGKNGKLFTLIKFRNMKELYDSHGDLLPPSQRITKIGYFLRRTSLDEVLNFWSVLKGDMSLIGPRPLVPEYTLRYNKRHKMRLSVKPGLECPFLEKSDHIRDWQEQFDNDVYYVEHISFKLDCKMVFQLFEFMINRKNSAARANVGRGIFMGYGDGGRAINLEQVSQDDINECFKEMEESR